ncbi:hypothetical protein HY312_02485 [Candidatus Saccharibacteria bacterium]|nr:hypothetical protein [Candidatus Saccharibacteria bacterium]
MEFLKTSRASRILLITNLILSITYFVYFTFMSPIGNPVLFGLLVVAGLYHLWQVLSYIHSVWPRKRHREFDPSVTPLVGVFITVCGEPNDIVEETVIATKAMEYPNFNIYILNDGFVGSSKRYSLVRL